MKNDVRKRGLSLMLTVVMILSMLMTVPQLSTTSEAASKKYVKSLSVKKKVTVQKGKTVTVKPTVKVNKKASKQVTVKSKNKKIAKVTYSKKKNTITIKGVKVGKTTITVTTKAKNKKGKKISKKISVTVKKATKATTEQTTTQQATEQQTTAQQTTEQQTTTEKETQPTTPKPEKPTQPVGDSGKVLNIYCWNEEFQTRVTDHYPGYEVVDDVTGKIGDVVVKWNITPNMDNAYQEGLDVALANQTSASADNKVDIFLVEADYAGKYVDSSYTMAISDLGITDTDLAQQYAYTKNLVKDAGGKLKAVTWQSCPCAMFYNRDIALDVLGTDDPAEVQKYVKDWDTFNATAAEMKQRGYNMVSSVNDTYRIYSNNVTSKWVEDNELNIDANIMKWVDDSQALVDAGSAGTHDLWSYEWMEGFFPEGKVFAYFGPAWLVNFSMSADVEGSVGYNGGWGATEGPQSAFWGGTWICAATGTDNKALIKDIMLKLTCDATVMKGIAEQDDDFVNNKAVMDELAKSDYSSHVLGGQNPLGVYSNNAAALDGSYSFFGDYRYNNKFQLAMGMYFNGRMTKDEAIEYFKELLTQEDSPSDIPEEDEPSYEWSDDVEDRVYVSPLVLTGQAEYALFSPNKYVSTSYIDGLEWSSSNPDVASINQYGYIDYLSEGNAIIQASYKNQIWTSEVRVVSSDPSQYSLSVDCDSDSISLDLKGNVTWENPLNLEYRITGDCPTSVEYIVYRNQDLPVGIMNESKIENNAFSIDIFLYSEFEEESTGTITTILWDPETQTIYGVKEISVIVE